MGPLVSRAAFDKLAGFRTPEAIGAGERVLCVDPGLPPPYVGAGLVRFPTPEQGTPHQRQEIFGPEAALHPISSLATSTVWRSSPRRAPKSPSSSITSAGESIRMPLRM